MPADTADTATRPGRFDGVRLAEIERRARDAQHGRWPDQPYELARLLRLSSASWRFVLSARADVLWLAGELRRALADQTAAS